MGRREESAAVGAALGFATGGWGGALAGGVGGLLSSKSDSRAHQERLAALGRARSLFQGNRDNIASERGSALGSIASRRKDAEQTLGDSLATLDAYRAQMAKSEGRERSLGEENLGRIAESGRRTDRAFQPYVDSGTRALSELDNLYSSDPNVSAGAFERFRQTPGYAFQLKEGEKHIDKRIASSGLRGSGAAQRAQLAFAQGLADDAYGEYEAGLRSMANRGLTATQNAESARQAYLTLETGERNKLQEITRSYLDLLNRSQGEERALLWREFTEQANLDTAFRGALVQFLALDIDAADKLAAIELEVGEAKTAYEFGSDPLRKYGPLISEAVGSAFAQKSPEGGS